MDMALVQRIEELRRLSVPALQEKYREVLGLETGLRTSNIFFGVSPGNCGRKKKVA